MNRNKINFMLRKFHLYLGLFFAPWVIIIALSGILFQYPDDLTKLPSTQAQTASELLPNKDEIVKSVLARTNLQGPPEAITYREVLSYEQKKDYTKTQIILDPEFMDLLLRKNVISEDQYITLSEPQPNQENIMKLLSPKTEKVAQTLQSLGIDAQIAKLKRIPDLYFKLGEKQYLYNLVNDKLMVVPQYQLGFSKFIQKLHKAHVFYGPVIRHIWLWFSQLIGLTFIFWALSGIFMWLQNRKIRKIGIKILSASFVCMAILLTGMYQYILNS